MYVGLDTKAFPFSIKAHQDMKTSSTCLNCGSQDLRKTDDYKYNVEFDRELLGCSAVVTCVACGLNFADPMPSLDALEAFYSKVYRAPGRPHWTNPSLPPRPSGKHYSWLYTISQSLRVEELRTAFEIGPGAGELGLLIQAAAPTIQLYCSEPDQHSHQVLRDRGYQNVSSAFAIPNKAELVVSTHSLEHFSSIDAFFQVVENVIAPNGVIFLEVPNCPFGEGYENRAYDSPHLLFFTKRSMRSMFESRGYDIMHLSTVGPTFDEGFRGAKLWKMKYNGWSPAKPFPDFQAWLLWKVKSWSYAYKLRSALSFARGRSAPVAATSDFIHDRKQGWNLRAVAKRRNIA